MEPERSSRNDGRTSSELRAIQIIPHFLKYPAGSVLVAFGETRVVCSVSIEERVPPFLIGKGQGWLTAEYAMLPGATHTRSARESTRGKVGGRTHEIQRLIGRSLRTSLDLGALGERTLTIDCDVLQADGGTRTASITGSYVALVLALETLRRQGKLPRPPLRTSVAAVSVGVVDGVPLLDLCYEEDHRCDVDMNLVMTREGRFIEIQGTAEGEPFSGDQLSAMLELGRAGIDALTIHQERALSEIDLTPLRHGNACG